MEQIFRVMIVEDSETQALKLRLLLEEEGCEVSTAVSAESALAELNQSLPDLMIVDNYLPGMRGEDLCRRVRMNLNTRGIPILMLTGAEAVADEMHGLQSGADDYVSKSESSDILLLRIRALLRKAPAQAAVPNPGNSEFQRARLLAIDDSPAHLEFLSTELRAQGYDVETASCGPDGLERLAQENFDFVLVDLFMPGMDGIEVCRRIATMRDATATSLAVVMLTASQNKEDMTRGLEAGADDFVTKSSDLAVLRARMQALLRRRFFQEENLRAIEEFKTTELEALRTRADLEAGEQRAALSEKVRIELEKASTAKDVFLATMSHELRTPLNAILGMADMLRESHLDLEQTQYVDVLRRAGSGLLLLINDILDLSKLEAGHLELERVEFDLEEVVDQAIELTAVKARAKGIVMLSHLTPGVVAFLWGDPTRLKQVLINLLGNAVKFTQSGEVILTARNHESGKPGQIEFAVSDTGIGIPSEKLETIFDDFTQADVSMTRKYGGTGLGLGISRRLVEAMGGQLTASSSQGEGSTFRFVAQFDPAPEKSREIPVSPEEFRGKRALLINDNATGCLILRETVQNWGLESDAFGSPAEALVCLREAAAEKRYSLALIDVSSSAMDGFEVAIEIRRIAGNLPIVMLTSDSRPGDATRRVEAGLSGYAIKPVARAHLRRLIWEAMEMRGRTGPLPEENGVRKEQALGAPCRILVAEDSEDNRLLIELFLKGSPYQLTFEVDGQAAVDRFATSDFDLILMDVRMPVMEGLAATRAIRALELQRGGSASIPIIALTADASLKDVERSSNAGCNAHLSKPISKLQLLSAIETYRRRRPVDMAQPASLEPILVDIPPGLESIVPPYLASRRKEVNDMVELLAIPDFARLTRLGHNLKGSGGGYGFPELTRLGAAVEHLAKEKDGEGIRTTLTELSTYLDRVQLS